MDWVNWVEKFGLVGMLTIGVCAMFFFILKWVLEQAKVELTENRKDRKEYLEALFEMKREMAEHNIRAKEFQCAVQAEHKEMITSLGRINGYK